MHIVTHIVVHVFNFIKKISTMILYTMSRPTDTVGMALKIFLFIIDVSRVPRKIAKASQSMILSETGRSVLLEIMYSKHQ